MTFTVNMVVHPDAQTMWLYFHLKIIVYVSLMYKLQVLTEVTVKSAVFYVLTPCGSL
jgi:hypothetical protein